MTSSPADVGPQNPDLRNSPIAWEYLEEDEWVGTSEEEQPGCFFNGTAYQVGSLIRCDDAVLECRNGFWKPIMTGDPENP
jgi:hypothetical protein